MGFAEIPTGPLNPDAFGRKEMYFYRALYRVKGEKAGGTPLKGAVPNPVLYY